MLSHLSTVLVFISSAADFHPVHPEEPEAVRRTLCAPLSAKGPRADAEGQGFRLESQPEFEILAELNRAARE